MLFLLLIVAASSLRDRRQRSKPTILFPSTCTITSSTYSEVWIERRRKLRELGTRVQADPIPESAELGEVPEEIAYNYDPKLDEVRRLLAYAAEHEVAPVS